MLSYFLVLPVKAGVGEVYVDDFNGTTNGT